VGIVSLVENITPKLKEKRITCIFVRYTENHISDYYRIWYKQTKKILSNKGYSISVWMIYKKII